MSIKDDSSLFFYMGERAKKGVSDYKSLSLFIRGTGGVKHGVMERRGYATGDRSS